MTRTPTTLPAAFTEHPFRTASARSAGIGAKVLRHPRFVSVHRGVHRYVPESDFARDPASPPAPEQRQAVPAQADPDAQSFPEAIAAGLAAEYAPLLRPGEAFSHTTAMLLLGIPIRPARNELHVTAVRPLAPVRRPRVIGHAVRRSFEPVIADEGFPCVPHPLALLQSAKHLGFEEAVVAIDALICPRGGSRDPGTALMTREQLADAIAGSRVAGIARLRAALAVAREGAESRMETRLHLELARLGLDVLELQAELRDAEGRLIGRFDAVDRRRRRILEYDGEQHRLDRHQYLRDEDRLDRARREGYAVLRLHREDFDPARVATTRGRLVQFLGLHPRQVPRVLSRYLAPA